MGGYLGYSTYKDSNVEWLGIIPKHWDVSRFKFLLSTPFKYGANEVAAIDDPDLPRYIRITDVKEDGTLRDDTFRSLPEEVAEDYLLEEGDILLARSGATVGKPFIYRQSWRKAAYAGYLIRARINEQNSSSFIYKFLQSSAYWNWVNSIFIQATIQNISAEKYANLFISIPPLGEQKQIAHFLDYKTAQIDALIAKKEALLEKLSEQRSAIITQAVTKGLDPTVPMKDSGIEWLGKIPEHWKVTRTKFLVTHIGSGKTPRGGSEVYINDGIILLRSQNIHDEGLRLDEVVHITDEADTLQANSRVKPQDVLLNITGASIGRTSLVPNNFASANVNQHVCIFRPNLKIVLPSFLHLLMCSKQAKEQIYSQENGTSREGLNFRQAGNLVFALPPLEEQDFLMREIYKKLEKFNTTAQKITKMIALLKEYRTALITNAVTGKIDVRHIKIPELYQYQPTDKKL